MNMNAVRLSHYPADPEFLEACDSLGLYVENELSGWHWAHETGRNLVCRLLLEKKKATPHNKVLRLPQNPKHRPRVHTFPITLTS